LKFSFGWVGLAKESLAFQEKKSSPTDANLLYLSSRYVCLCGLVCSFLCSLLCFIFVYVA
jgi:hypothetical protein